MIKTKSDFVSQFAANLKAKNPGERQFHQTVQDFVETIQPALDSHPEYCRAKILERIVEPERVIMFRVPWTNDQGDVQVNRGFRVQFNSAIGPYKGGLRFHSSVNLDTFKSLAFEQVLKNSLTGLPLGGGKGGSDFNPRGKSDNEVMRFCQSFMIQLFRHIGANTDVPAGDIGVGGRELGFLFGQYKRLTGRFEGVLTGKGMNWGGSLMRPEATGYGVAYFTQEMLATRNKSFKGKRVAISGAGNVAQHVAEKVIELGGKIVTISDEFGFIVDEEGLDKSKLALIKQISNVRRGKLQEFVSKFSKAHYTVGHEGKWNVKVDIALPCAIENELDGKDAQTLVDNGCICVVEGANMPCMPEAVDIFLKNKILYCPGKAANAGGVAVSGLEMAQNSQRCKWTSKEIDARLRRIMQSIHDVCLTTSQKYGEEGNYVMGANIAGFLKVADAMLDQGIV